MAKPKDITIDNIENPIEHKLLETIGDPEERLKDNESSEKIKEALRK